MSRKRPWKWVVEKSKSPVWNSIAAVVGIVSIAIPFVIGYMVGFRSKPVGPNRLIVESETQKALIEFPGNVSARTRILIDGKEEQELRLFVYRVQFKGNRPLRPNDFEEPLRGNLPSDRKLIAVQKASNLEGPRLYDEQTRRSSRDPAPPINFEARILDAQHFEIKPFLMNPGEWFGIEMYTSANGTATQVNSSEQYDALSHEISWSCHVAEIKCPASLDLNLDLGDLGFNKPWYLQIFIYHYGGGVYVLALLTTVNLLVLVALARATRLRRSRAMIQFLLLGIAVPLSFFSGEVSVHWIIDEYPFNMEQEWGIQALFWVNVALIVLLSSVAIFTKRMKRRPS
jgi:hypothetical protein